MTGKKNIKFEIATLESLAGLKSTIPIPAAVLKRHQQGSTDLQTREEILARVEDLKSEKVQKKIHHVCKKAHQFTKKVASFEIQKLTKKYKTADHQLKVAQENIKSFESQATPPKLEKSLHKLKNRNARINSLLVRLKELETERICAFLLKNFIFNDSIVREHPLMKPFLSDYDIEEILNGENSDIQGLFLESKHAATFFGQLLLSLKATITELSKEKITVDEEKERQEALNNAKKTLKSDKKRKRESHDLQLAETKPKNRPGQQARRQKWIQLYGDNAIHLKIQNETAPRRLYSSKTIEKRPSENLQHKPTYKAPAQAAAPHMRRENNLVPEQLHPSWEAKRKQKELIASGIKGTKIVFGE